MEVAISAVTGELVSRFISFLKNKYHSLSHAQSEKMVERLQHLLMRVSIVVEEADGRYITNSGMLLQLKMLSGAMYNGYRVLDTLRYQNLQDIAGYEKVSINDSSSSSSYLAIPFKRSRTKTEKDDKAMRLDTDGSLESLEIVVANMPIFLSVLSYDELRYLFKTLAFGSVDFVEHPRLVQIADEFAKELHSMQDTLVATNMYADVLRRNLDVQFWLCILDKGRRFIKRKLSIYGVHPTTLLEQGHPVDITDVALHPLSMRRYTINVAIKEELPSVTMGELLTDPNVRPKEDFILISWESRIPPYNSFARLVTNNAQGTREDNALQGRKRRGVPM
uniref:Uncharacterized protein n=1 Tax=Aegilops tauschii TaxID=37682 RepID=M8B6W5_AEGTA